MSDKRCNRKRLSISSEGNHPKRKNTGKVCTVTQNEIALEETFLQPDPPCNFERSLRLATNLQEDYKQLGQHLKAIIAKQQLKIETFQEELCKLKAVYNSMKMKEAEIKRTRWCYWCEREATFLSNQSQFFYCSTECEEYHLETLQDFIEIVD